MVTNRRWMLSLASSVIAIVLGVSTAASAYPCNADPYDTNDDSSDLQSCLNGGGTIALITDGSPGYQGYYLSSPLVISQNGTTLTSNASGYVVFKATSSLSGRMLNATSKSSFTLSHLRFIGRGITLGWTKANLGGGDVCGDYGQNVNLNASSYFTVDDVQSSGAVCGSGMVVDGSAFEVMNSWFHDNGTPANVTSDSFADGLTVGECDGCYIHDNTLEDNTDIDLVVGGGHDGVIEYNTIYNSSSRHAFGGLHVGWFPSGDGDHGGTVYRYNSISSDEDGLAFGIIVGYEPWDDPYHPLRFVSDAGSVYDNDVVGAVVNLAVDGIGDGYVSGNSLSYSQGSYGYFCSYSGDYTAHYFGNASLQGGYANRWFFHGSCGSYNGSVPQPGAGGSLTHDAYLSPNATLSSGSNNYHLVYQLDGNLVLYNSGWSPTWASGYSGTPDYAIMQADGNFVVYHSGPAADFDTGSWGNEGAYVVVQDDGNVVVYDISGSVLWSIF